MPLPHSLNTYFFAGGIRLWESLGGTRYLLFFSHSIMIWPLRLLLLRRFMQ